MNSSLIKKQMQAALALQSAGKFLESINIYLDILSDNPNQYDAHHCLGIAYWCFGQQDVALTHLKQALSAPQVPSSYWLAVIDALTFLGRYSEAQHWLVKVPRRQIIASELILRAQASNPPAEIQKKIFEHFQHEELEACRAITHPLLAEYPAFGQGWKMMAYLFQMNNEYRPALEAGQHAAFWLADDPEVFNNLGISSRSVGELVLAEQAYRQALVLDPNRADTYYNLSALLYEQERSREAEFFCRKALALHPNYVAGLNNLANMLRGRGELIEAEVVCRQALALKSDYVLAHNNLGIILHGQHRFDEAEASYRRALALSPTDLKVLNNLGNLLKARGRLNEAANCYLSALEQAPDMAELHGNLANVKKDLGELNAAIAGFSYAIKLKPAQVDMWHNLLLTLQYSDQTSIADCIQWHHAFAEHFERPWRDRLTAHRNDFDPKKRLRVGWVSADFCNHAVSYFSLPLVQALVAQPELELELYAYSQTLAHDPISKQLEACFFKWRHVLGLNDEELFDCIRNDQIDILIDLSGHTANNRLLVFARKPAPVQVSWLGYPDSSGLTHMDWRITDYRGDPEGVEHRYSEKLWRLPDVFCCYRPMIRFPERRLSADYAVNTTPALQAGYITFGCCNNIAKLTQTTLNLWARVLDAVPNSRLLLELAGLEQSSLGDQLLADFAAFGVPAERLQLVHRDRDWQYRRYHQIDIALDPFPANGGTSSCDVLWMGVPLITLCGERFVSRMGCSLLHAVGHPEWIASSSEEYLLIAINLASNVSSLNNIRQKLREESEASPLMNEKKFAQQFAAALRGMWIECCEGNQSY